MRSSAALLTRPPHREPRVPRISWRRRLRAIVGIVLDLAREIIRTPGYRRGEDFLQLAAREARERDEAIAGSVGAMSAADIQRIAQYVPPDRDPAERPTRRFPR
jgi:hypothetical protein